MQPTILFFQGAGDGAYDEDHRLVDSLQQSVGNKYRVIYPKMPDEGMPDYTQWKPVIAKAIEDSSEPLILVGHSLGAYFLVRYLSEETLQKPIRSIHLIAPPYPWGDKNWEFEDLTLPDNFGAKLPKTKIFLYHSRDDQIVPFAHMALYAEAVPNAATRTTTDGHQLGNNLAVVAADIVD